MLTTKYPTPPNYTSAQSIIKQADLSKYKLIPLQITQHQRTPNGTMSTIKYPNNLYCETLTLRNITKQNYYTTTQQNNSTTIAELQMHQGRPHGQQIYYHPNTNQPHIIAHYHYGKPSGVWTISEPQHPQHPQVNIKFQNGKPLHIAQYKHNGKRENRSTKPLHANIKTINDISPYLNSLDLSQPTHQETQKLGLITTLTTTTYNNGITLHNIQTEPYNIKTYYAPNQTVIAVLQTLNNQPHGQQRYYFQSGKIQLQALYKKGIPIGTWIFRASDHQGRKLKPYANTTHITFNANGKIKSVIHYDKNQNAILK